MITKDQAKTQPKVVYYIARNGRIQRARVTGKFKEWKRDGRFRLPCKFGDYYNLAVDNNTAHDFYLTVEEAIAEHPNAELQKGLQ